MLVWLLIYPGTNDFAVNIFIVAYFRIKCLNIFGWILDLFIYNILITENHY